MNSVTRSAKKTLRTTLQFLGLYKFAQRIKQLPKRKMYRNTSRFTATINDIDVQFRTEDEYSNSWFFPRYGGGRIHERKVTEMIVESLQEAKCFVDIGTNLGWYTCIAAKHMPAGKVYGFEMDELNYGLLQENLALNDFSNVEVHHNAVSDSPGVVSYQRESDRPSPTFFMQSNPADDESTELVEVNSITIDDFLKRKGATPDVMKIDVEGAEDNVLRGMLHTLRECRPILFLELHPTNLKHFNSSTSSVLSLLIENNYNVFEIEQMRDQASATRMTPLQKDSKIEDNSMLYAIPAEES